LQKGFLSLKRIERNTLSKTFEFEVYGQPVPKPRMTRRDSGKVSRIAGMRPIVRGFLAYKDSIWAVMMSKPRVQFRKARLAVTFHIEGEPRMDLDNLCKSICDSIVPWLLPDDSVKCIPEIQAKAILKSSWGKTEIKLEEI